MTFSLSFVVSFVNQFDGRKAYAKHHRSLFAGRRMSPMMRFSNGNLVSDPLGRSSPPRERNEWEKRARKALDSWAGGSEASVAVAIEAAHQRRQRPMRGVPR